MRAGVVFSCLLFLLVPIRVNSALFRRKLADVVVVISLAKSKNLDDAKDASNLFREFVSVPQMPLIPFGMRIAVVSNTVGYRTRLLMPLTNGRTTGALVKVTIAQWNTTQNRSIEPSNFQVIVDAAMEDAFGEDREGSGDREEAPDIVVLYVVDPNRPWSPLVHNSTTADVVVMSTGRESSTVIDNIAVWQRHSDLSIRNLSGLPADEAIIKAGQGMAIALSNTMRRCLYKLVRKPCYFVKGLVDDRYMCPCVYDVTSRVIRPKPGNPDRRYCAGNTSHHVPCEYELGAGCVSVKQRFGAGLPMWIFWIIFGIIGVPLLILMCCLPPWLMTTCLLPMLIKDIAENAVMMTLEKVLENVIADQGEAEEEEGWEDVEEEGAGEEEEEAEEETKKRKKKKKGKKTTRRKKKMKRGKMKKGELRKGKMAKRLKMGKITPKTRKTVTSAAKRFKGKGKVFRKGAKPVGKPMARILLRILRMIKCLKKGRGK